MNKLYSLLLIPGLVHATEIYNVWGSLPTSFTKTSTASQLNLISEENGHQRFQWTYKGIPVWGYQIIKHPNGKLFYTGQRLERIENDINSLLPLLSEKDIQKKYLPEDSHSSQIKKIIYIDTAKKAKLAYELSYFIKKNNRLSHPVVIIDANNSKILRSFDSIHSQRVGRGLGGNTVDLPFRQGIFSYGDTMYASNSLGMFDVTIRNGNCFVANSNFEVANLQNKDVYSFQIPISVAEEHQYPVFNFPCSRKSGYLNYNDNGYSPAHEGYSPVNDAMYFAQSTLDMYQQIYGDDKPFGNDLPIRIYTHIANLDNAFSIDTQYELGKLVSHQQVIIGNGDKDFAPMSQTTIPHELSHNVTSQYSNLIYDRQSGGINEAFSDMADLALRYYLSRLYPWYWNGEDWSIGREESLTAEPLRYMEKPSDDGYSIDSAKDYYEGLDVHFSSGVFNRAFYLLAHKDNWNVQKAFQVMFDANRYYWVANTNFDFAACGVIQATIDRGWEYEMVIQSFNEVGVSCPVSL